jgi:lipid-A-disaccharide synthase
MSKQKPAAPIVALVAGETSGDLLAGLLLDGLRARWPGLTSHGIGGPQMAKRGFQAWWPSEKLAVRGYVEVLRHYREIVGIRRRLRDRLLADKPDVFIGVDAPDFNLDLEGDLRGAGIRCVHFVAPSVWAWRPKRVEKLKRCTDHVLCIFPFEPELFERFGIPSTYVGHPLANVIPMVPDRAAARLGLGLPLDASILAVLPGSRASEVQYLARRFFDACRLIRLKRPDMLFVVPAIPALRDQIIRVARDAGMADVIRFVEGRSHAVLAACDATLIASGTATLEAALFKRPMVIAYNMHWLSWWLMAPKRLQAWVGLPNILCREFVVPELLQDAATPQALADAVLDWWSSPEKIAELTEKFNALHHELQRDTPALCADAIQKVLET